MVMVDHLSEIRNRSKYVKKRVCMVVSPNEYSLHSNLNANKFIASCTKQVEFKKLPLIVWT